MDCLLIDVSGADVPITELSLTVLKGLVHQMLDRSINDPNAQKAILEATTRAVVTASAAAPDPQVEDVLWTAVEAALTSNIHFMIVIDGLDQMRNTDASATRFLSRLENAISSPRTPSKLIVFSRALPTEVDLSNAQFLTMDTSKTGDDLKVAVCDMMSLDSQFHGLDAANTETIAKAIVSNARGSFVWAQLAVQYIGQHKTASEMLSAARKAPKSVDDLVDSHLNAIDLDQQEARLIIAWLAASERPLQIQEVKQLLTIDTKGPSFISRVTSPGKETFRPVNPLITTHDGFAAFRHHIVRERVRQLADSMEGDYSNQGKFPFNMQEAHYELLVRSLAWVKFCLKEEVDISFDKMAVDKRDAFLETHTLLEYTSRYWYSHLLSSPLVSADGTFNFVDRKSVV